MIQASIYLNEIKNQSLSYQTMSAKIVKEAGFEEQSKSLLNKPKLD